MTTTTDFQAYNRGTALLSIAEYNERLERRLRRLREIQQAANDIDDHSPIKTVQWIIEDR